MIIFLKEISIFAAIFSFGRKGQYDHASMKKIVRVIYDIKYIVRFNNFNRFQPLYACQGLIFI